MTSARTGKRGNGTGRKRGAARASDSPPLDALTIAGFKSIRDSTRIALRPLTVLAGQNSSGKSSAMQPLLLLKQTLEAPYDPGPLRLDGENVQFNSAEQLFWRRPGDHKAKFELCLEIRGASVGLAFHRDKRGVLRAKGREHGRLGATGQFLSASQIPGVFQELVREGRLDSAHLQQLPSPHVLFWRLNLPRAYQSLIEGLIHVPGLRGNPARHYPTTRVSDNFPAVFSPYTASVIATWGETRDTRLKRLGAWLSALGLTWKAEAHRVDDTRVELRVGRLASARRGGADDLVNVADVGFGVSQVLPVLVALLVAKPGQIVYLEQPEIHLHPKAQVALAACLLEAAKRGVLVVAETHSHLLLRGIQEQVVSGKYEPALVALHWFARDADGATHVTSADLDRNGAFGDWPEDLSDTELEIEDRYLRHVAPKA